MTSPRIGAPAASTVYGSRVTSGAAPSPAVSAAYAHCADIARRSGSSFLAAFWMFPRDERRALHAIYAFCRLVDDIADDPALRGDRGMLLERWHEELVDAYRGKARHPVGIALGDAVHRFHLPEECFLDLLAGILGKLGTHGRDGIDGVRFALQASFLRRFRCPCAAPCYRAGASRSLHHASHVEAANKKTAGRNWPGSRCVVRCSRRRVTRPLFPPP